MSPITLNTTEQRFEMHVDGVTAYLTFERSGNTIAYTHTIVPQALGGRGIGSQLARHALDYAAAHQLQVDPQCSFVDGYMRKHPEYEALRAG